MTRRQVMIRAPSLNRREPFLKTRPSLSTAASSTTSITKVHVGEAIGGTLAECVAVCCFCPCGIVKLIVLAVYRVPENLCRRAWRRRKRRRLIKKGLLSPKGRRLTCGCEEGEMKVTAREEVAVVVRKKKDDDEQQQLEEEMWDRFYGTGFWRSPSQRE